MRWLAGDIGGTKTWLALYEERRGVLHEIRDARFPSGDYESLTPIIETFLDGQRVSGAGLGIAGPVVDDRVRVTNLPWEIDARQLEADLAIARVRMVNDFAAVAWGIEVLDPANAVVIQEGSLSSTEPRCVIGPGTGLGQVVSLPSEHVPRVLSSEGGHVDFAPRNELEDELLGYLRRKHGRVSVERVVSGMGLVNIWSFIVDTDRAATGIAAEVEQDGAAAIGRNPDDPAAGLAIELFVSALGAEAGNLALKVLPGGGLWIAGGIPPKIRARFDSFDEVFLKAMHDKGRMRPLLENTAVRLITDSKVGLLGAAHIAQRL